MVRFADILQTIEGASPGSPEGSPNARVSAAIWDHDIGREAASAAFSADKAPFTGRAEKATYEIEDEIAFVPLHPSPEPPRVTRPDIDLGRELAADRLQRLSTTELKALRRVLARRVHPDAQSNIGAQDSDAMARVNSAIDAAMAKKRLTGD